MSSKKIWLFDTTLRDGGQTRGVDFLRADKIAITNALDEIGVDYVEAGWPGATTRVLIEFCVPDGTIWRTVGLSTNIIDASVAALGDGMIWKLQYDKVDCPKSELA